jgi:hypothetical protein
MKHSVAAILAAAVLLLPIHAMGISRDEVLIRAQTYCYHPWHCSSSNLTASCLGSYQSAYTPGDYVGLPYDWGGYVTLFQFDDGLKQGKGAGSYSDHGVLGCTVGLDCSGFVSKAWGVGHFGTSTISQTSHEIAFNDVKPGDAFNEAGYHIVLFGGELEDGWPYFYEAAGYNTFINTFGGWGNVSGFAPIRLDSISGSATGATVGTAVSPIPVTQFPYVHNGNTVDSLSDMFDYYGADTSKKETGPEVIYELTINAPGNLTVSVQDGPNSDVDGVDIDVHVCRALDSYHCIARHDKLIEMPIIECGTWYVIADTWSNASGTEFPGAYTLTINYESGGNVCSTENEPFDFSGEPGDGCGYPGQPQLPFCNPNLGAEICLYSDQPGNSFSFCTFGCDSDYDCTSVFPGGCCADIGSIGDPLDFFCVDGDFCESDPPLVDESSELNDVINETDSNLPHFDISYSDQPCPKDAFDIHYPKDDSSSADFGQGNVDRVSVMDFNPSADTWKEALDPNGDNVGGTGTPGSGKDSKGCSGSSQSRSSPVPLLYLLGMMFLLRFHRRQKQ